MVILLKDVLCSNGDEGMRINIIKNVLPKFETE
jgi:hypothetical protein